jgi:peptidyl-prolyl cis-trans isomerase D
MLQKIRDGSSGPLAYVVVAVIAFIFGVWGIGSYFTPSSDPVVASAAGTDITQSQFRNAFNQRYQQLRQRLGDNFDSSKLPRQQVRKNVLNSLIDQAVMTDYAKSSGYRVTDGELLAQIRSTPQFQDNGEFSAQRYKALLSQAGMKPSQYEARLRQNMLDSQVRRVLAQSAFAVSPQVDTVYKKAYEQRKIGVVTFDPAAYASQVSVGGDKIKHYYDQHPKQFMQPQRVKLAYVQLNADQLAAQEPDADTLKKLYHAHRAELGTPEKRSADEVRIPVASGKGDQARETMKKVLAAAKDGDALQDIAARTPGAQFKHIDKQSQAALPDAVGKALFDLQSHELSSPVRGDNAWHLLRLTGTTPARSPDFNDPGVQKRLKAMAKKQSRAQQFRAKSQKLEDLAYQAPNNLKTIANKLGLKIQHTGWVSQSGADSGIGQNDAVRKAAFSDAVLKDKLNSEVLDLGDQRHVVLRVTDHQKASRKPLSEVRDQVRDRLRADQAQARARQAAKQALGQAKNGQSLADIAASAKGATFNAHGFVGRSEGQLDPRILETAFGLPYSTDAKHPRYGITTTGDDKIALVGVTGSRVNKDKSNQAGPNRQQIAQRLSGYNAHLEYQALDNYLRQQADVKIHKDVLQEE